MLGKCPLFQERLPRNLRHPIINQWQWSRRRCLQSNNEGFEVSGKDIVDCYRIGKRGKTIVKFSKMKVSKQVLKVRKDLTKLSIEDLQLTGQGKWYINQSLCPYYRVLWSKSKSLHSIAKIFSYYVSNGTVKIKIQKTSQPLSIMHISDLDKLLPDVDLSPTVWRRDCFALLSPEGNLGSL